MRSKIPYYPITQGHLITAWQIIHLVSKYDSISLRSVINITVQSGIFGGTVPTRQGLRLCHDYGFVLINSGRLQITELSISEIICFCIISLFLGLGNTFSKKCFVVGNSSLGHP